MFQRAKRLGKSSRTARRIYSWILSRGHHEKNLSRYRQAIFWYESGHFEISKKNFRRLNCFSVKKQVTFLSPSNIGLLTCMYKWIKPKPPPPIQLKDMVSHVTQLTISANILILPYLFFPDSFTAEGRENSEQTKCCDDESRHNHHTNVINRIAFQRNSHHRCWM